MRIPTSYETPGLCVNLSFLFSVHDSESALSKSKELILSGIYGNGSDLSYSLDHSFGNALVVCDTSGDDDLINISLENG